MLEPTRWSRSAEIEPGESQAARFAARAFAWERTPDGGRGQLRDPLKAQASAGGALGQRGRRSYVTIKAMTVGSSVSYVLDYPAMGKPGEKPRMLHRTDCPHPKATA